jgi:hypothetical protein
MQGDAMSSRKTFLVTCTVLVSLMLCLPAIAQGPSDATVSDPETSDAAIDQSPPNAPDPQNTAAAANDDGWHFGVTPYIWFAGVSGTVGALGHDVGIHVSPGDLLSHFDIGAMAAVEARKNRLVLPVDFLFIKLKADKGVPLNDFVNSIQFKGTVVILAPKAGYRIVDHEKLKVDALAGIRYWHIGETLNAQPQLFNGFSRSQNWVDAIAGGKIEMALSEKALVTISGDAGGGGADLDYQAIGALGYRLGKKAILQLGYRYLYVNYHNNPPPSFLFDAHLSGAILGVTFNLK